MFEANVTLKVAPMKF